MCFLFVLKLVIHIWLSYHCNFIYSKKFFIFLIQFKKFHFYRTFIIILLTDLMKRMMSNNSFTNLGYLILTTINFFYQQDS